VAIAGAGDVDEEDDDVESDELVVDSATVVAVELEVAPDVVGRSGVDDDAVAAQPVRASRDAQRPATAGRRSTQQYGTTRAGFCGRKAALRRY